VLTYDMKAKFDLRFRFFVFHDFTLCLEDSPGSTGNQRRSSQLICVDPGRSERETIRKRQFEPVQLRRSGTRQRDLGLS